MIVGDDIKQRNLMKNASVLHLKNGTLDLTIGEIIPVGLEAAKKRESFFHSLGEYTIEPQEMVWIMSEEEFALPNDVTGLATLRTTLTHKGLLALNVGIVDANFHGKISTALINFSSEGRTIYKGEKFFRIIFFEHNSIPDQYKNKDSALPRPEIYQRALSQFPKNFLNIPELNEDYYGRQFGKMLKGWIKQHYLIVVVVTVIIGLNLYSLMNDAIKLLKWWNSSS